MRISSSSPRRVAENQTLLSCSRTHLPITAAFGATYALSATRGDTSPNLNNAIARPSRMRLRDHTVPGKRCTGLSSARMMADPLDPSAPGSTAPPARGWLASLPRLWLFRPLGRPSGHPGRAGAIMAVAWLIAWLVIDRRLAEPNPEFS